MKRQKPSPIAAKLGERLFLAHYGVKPDPEDHILRRWVAVIEEYGIAPPALVCAARDLLDRFQGRTKGQPSAATLAKRLRSALCKHSGVDA